MRVLCVEDDPDWLELMAVRLAQAGYEVVTASNPDDAMELVRRGDLAVIILDNWLERGSGVEICKQIRSSNASIPILFCSAAAYETDAQEAIDAGAQEYLTKPIDFRVLIETISDLTHYGRGRSAAIN